MKGPLGADTLELAHIDYSYKPVKPIIPFEKPIMEQAVLITIPALLYGAMPNLGLYSQPDGPCPNPADLLPKGKIAEARASYEEAAEYAIADMVYVGSEMYEAGADGINFDTTAAAGDAEFYATLKAVEILRKKYPAMGIQMGMAAEFVLGMHGEIEYKGVRLAGLYPHQQVKLAEEAGVNIFWTGRQYRHQRIVALEYCPLGYLDQSLHGCCKDSGTTHVWEWVSAAFPWPLHRP